MPSRSRDHRPTLAALAAAGLLFAACSSTDSTAQPSPADPASAPAPATGFPTTVETCGRTSTFERPPERVIVSWPATVATLVELGQRDRIVGYAGGKYARFPEGATGLVEVSATNLAPKEAVLAQRPDFLLLDGQYQIAGEDGTLSPDDLDAAGIGTYVGGDYCVGRPGATSIEQLYTDITALGRIFGVPDRAEDLVERLRERVQAASAPHAGHRERVAFVQVADGQLYALSGTNYAAVIDAAGFENAFAGLSENFAALSPEQAVALDAHAVFVVHDDGTDRAKALDEVRALLPHSEAVKAGRVHGVDNGSVSATAGVSMVDVVEQIARAID